MAGRSVESVRRPAWMVVAGVLAAAAVVLVAGRRPEAAVPVGAFFSGGLAVGTGLAVVLATPRRRLRSARLSLCLLGSAMVVWGVGQLAVGAITLAGEAVFPTLGDEVSSLAAPLAVAGLLTTPRGPGGRGEWLRLVLDSSLLGAAMSLLVWRAAFRDVLFVHVATYSDFSALLILVTEVGLVSMLLLTWLRDLDRGLLLTVIGLTGYVLADLVTLHAVVQPGGQWSWPAAALWCVAWPVIGVGLVRYLPGAHPDSERHRSETRVTVATTVLSLVGLCGVMVLIARDPRLDPVSTLLSTLVIVVFGAREMFAGWQRRRLLTTLTLRSLRDPLTDLENRRGLTRCLRELSRGQGGSVLTLDLDGFKEVNDVLGHSSGDALLVAVARQVERSLPADAEAFRVGGDEFAIVVPGGPDRALVTAEQLLGAVRRAADDVPGAAAVSVSASIGVGRLGRWLAPHERTDDGGRESDQTLTVLVESGAALRAAKTSGRDRVEFYDGTVAAAHRRSLLVERRLAEAITAGGIDVHYQPVLELAGRRVVGLEALARWTDPLIGRIGPDEFIPLAERAGLIGALGDHVLRRAVGDLAALREQLPDVNIAVNVSPVQLRQAGFAQHVLDLLREFGTPAAQLVVEVTESVFVDVDDPALRQLEVLRASGVSVAIDDFGSGFSSLAYLGRLPANILKVDQALTAMVLEDRRSLAVLRAVVQLGASLPMDVAVEGIETEAVHELVRSTGAAYGQGWLYAAAVPRDRLVQVVAELHGRAALTTGA